MKQSIILGIVAFAAASGLAACGGGSSNPNTGGGGGPTCTLPSTFAMVYPINNSTVPSTTGSVFVATQATNLANGNYNTAVQPSGGLPAYLANAFEQVPLSQVPKPRSLPTFSKPIYYRSFIAIYNGGLIAGATYQIGFNNTSTSCSPPLIDTFTTN
jgi:hypothetical protein